MTTTLRDKFLTLEKTLNNEVLERPDEIHSAILALISRRHMFMYGPPGAAKSFLVDRLVSYIGGMDDDDYFKWLLTKFSVPEELFGGPDFKLMQEEGIYKRITNKKLPRASIFWGDELFKANSAILNSLLTILNERSFENCDEDPHVPLISCFAASNELPASKELDALADRLHFWHYVQPLTEPSNFVRMLRLEVDDNPEPIITLEDIHEAHAQSLEVQLGDSDIYETFIDLADRLKTADIPVTDRRFHQTVDVIKAEAWLNGHERAEVFDMKPLRHMLWRVPENIDKVREIVLNLTDPFEKKVQDLAEQFEVAINAWQKILVDSDISQIQNDATIEMHGKYKEVKAEIKALKEEQKEVGRLCEPLNQLEQRSKMVITQIYEKLKD